MGRKSEKGATDSAANTHILPGLNKRAGPTPPQIIEAVANVEVDGQEKPLG